jgi:hypothetical protein
MSDIKNNIEKKNSDKIEFKKYFQASTIVKNIPFILFVSSLAIVYIFIGHYADGLTRKISKLEKSVKELEYEYKCVKSDVIYRSKSSELSKVVEPMGLKELKAPPMLLVDSSEEKK